MAKKDPNKYPKGLDAAKVKRIVEHYESQTEDEAVAEDEAAFGEGGTTVMEVPTRLVDQVLALIAESQSGKKRSGRPGRGGTTKEGKRRSA